MSTFAFVFPGQGSQSVGMLKELGAAYPAVHETFAAASDALGYDLWSLVQEGPEADLNRTDRTQPAMLAAGVATWRVWLREGGSRPVVMAGHSLGEYTALVCAGSIALEDAVRLVAERGRFMQEAVPEGEGAMAAILGLDDDTLLRLCADAAQGQTLSPANYNSPGQVVIAGHARAVRRAMDLAKQTGAKRCVLLPVSVPSHCALMAPAAQRLAERLRAVTITQPAVPVVHNVDVTSHRDPDAIRDALIRQLDNPVRWVETIRRLDGLGVRTVVEAGPGRVLAGLNRRIAGDMTALPVVDPDTLAEALKQTD